MYGKRIHVAEVIDIIWTEYFRSEDCLSDFHEFDMNSVEIKCLGSLVLRALWWDIRTGG